MLVLLLSLSSQNLELPFHDYKHVSGRQILLNDKLMVEKHLFLEVLD